MQQSLRPARHFSLTLRCFWLVFSIGAELPESTSRFLPVYVRASIGLRKFPRPGLCVLDLVFQFNSRRKRWRFGRVPVPRL